MDKAYCKISLRPLPAKPSKPGYHNAELKALFGSTRISPYLPFSRAEFFQSSRAHVQGMSISGVQQKLSLKINARHQLEPTAEGGEYILKPSPESYPHAAENEHAAMLVSKRLGIETAQCALVVFKGGELAYLTRRFDRLPNGQKRHQEDLMQCFGLPSDDKYRQTYEQAGQRLHRVTNGKQAVVLDFVRRVILAYVMGNDDLHLKNFSVQRRVGNTGLYYDKLTPNYDCLFCDALGASESGLGFLALGLLHDPDDGGEAFSQAYQHYGYYTGGDFIALGRRLGLAEKPVHTFIDKLVQNESKLDELIQRSYMPEPMKARAQQLLHARIRALLINRIQSIE